MSLRPRYSLLTLLILMALVAGGVKLWYGPHRVIERATGLEIEYTFTRDWRGERVIEGPWLRREYLGGKLTRMQIRYYRRGQMLDWRYVTESTDTPDTKPFAALDLSHTNLTPGEMALFRAAIEQERQRFQELRQEHWSWEGFIRD